MKKQKCQECGALINEEDIIESDRYLRLGNETLISCPYCGDWTIIEDEEIPEIPEISPET